MSKDLKAEGLSLLAANSGMEEVYMTKDGQGFADAHSAEDWNNKLGFKGKEGGPVKVARSGNEKAIKELAEEIAEAHEKSVAASLEEQAKIREEKKALKEAKKANRKGERVDVGGDNAALEAALSENEKLRARIAELETGIAPDSKEADPVEPAPEPAAPKKSNAKKKK